MVTKRPPFCFTIGVSISLKRTGNFIGGYTIGICGVVNVPHVVL